MTVEAPLPPPPVKDEEPVEEPEPQPEAAPVEDHGWRAVQTYRSSGVAMHFSNEQKQLIYEIAKKSLSGGQQVSQAEFDYFLAVCSIRGLNPLLREAHLIRTAEGGISVQVGIDGFRSLAEDTGQYAGQTAPEFEYAKPDASITVATGKTSWEKIEWGGRPIYAKVGVYRAGAIEPFWGESWIEEDHNGFMWTRRPHTMLAKVAEARAMRRAFPRSLSGIYAEGELSDALPVGDGPGRDVPALPTGPTDGPGAPVEAEVVSEGEFRVPEAPRPPEGGVAGEIVKVDPEAAYRSVKVSWLADNDVHRKVEVKLTVPGKGKLTAVLLDEMAEVAAEAELQNGEQLWVDDTKVALREWGKPEDKKPPIKELRAITAAKVYRAGAWQELTAAGRAAVEEAAPASAPPGPQLIELRANEVVQTIGVLTRIEWRDAGPDRRVAVLAVEVEDGFYRCAMEESEAKEQLTDVEGGWLYAVGERIAIMGAGSGGWLALTAVRTAP